VSYNSYENSLIESNPTKTEAALRLAEREEARALAAQAANHESSASSPEAGEVKTRTYVAPAVGHIALTAPRPF